MSRADDSADADADADTKVVIPTPDIEPTNVSVQQEFADIPGYDSVSHAAQAYRNSSADSIDEFRRTQLVEYLLNETTVAFDDVVDTDTYPSDGLITINDAGSMAVVRIDEVAEAVIIETGDDWIALKPSDVSNVIQALQMADDYLEADE